MRPPRRVSRRRQITPNRAKVRRVVANSKSIVFYRPVSNDGPPRIVVLLLKTDAQGHTNICKRNRRVHEHAEMHDGKRWPPVLSNCAQIQHSQPKLFCLWSQISAPELSPEPPDTPRHSRATP